MRIIGIDPGLQNTGWGIIDINGSSLTFVATGLVKTSPADDFAQRLAQIDHELAQAIDRFAPDSSAIEETFVNKNPNSTLKLGMARGAAITSLARAGLPVAEYAARLVKKAIVGTGGADKTQMGMMINHLLRIKQKINADQADALAVAICHANYAARPSLEENVS